MASNMIARLRDDADERRRSRLLADVDRQHALLRPGYKIWGYKNVFAKGFLLTEKASHYSPREDWTQTKFGRWHLQHDPLLAVQEAGTDELGVMVLGEAFDGGGASTRASVAGSLQRILTRSAETDRAAVDEAITWLSGRYLVFIRRGDVLDVYGDPLATRSCYWHKGGSGVAFASHTAILSELAGGLSSERMKWALNHPEYVSPAGKWLPGLITPHDGVGQIYANGRLTVAADGAVNNERFFPRTERVTRPPSDVFVEFRRELQAQVRNWMSVAPVTVLALTAGGDSRAILEAGLADFQRSRAVALTYHPFHVAAKSTYDDYVKANRLAAAAGLRHLVLDVAPMKPTSAMAGLYNRTFPTWQRYASLTNALYLCAPAKAATIFGVGGGIITGMIRDRSVHELTPELLAAKYAYSKVSRDADLHDEFARWMEFTQFGVPELRGYDFYDFFHWEHRMSKWAAAGYSEYDLATIPAPVLSSRKLLISALSLEDHVRFSGALYRSIRFEGSE